MSPRSNAVRHALALLAALVPVTPAWANWNSNPAVGTAVVELAQTQSTRAMVADGAGGAFIVWDDGRNGGGVQPFAQHLDANGNPLWTLNGVQVSSVTTTFGENMVLLSDGSGGVFVAWSQQRGATGFDMVGQHLDANGARLWGAGGIDIVALTGDQDHPCIVSDGAGGFIVAWDDGRTPANSTDIYAQRMNAAGVPQWSANGVALCVLAAAQSRPVIATDGLGGAFVVWTDDRNSATTGTDLYGQRVNSAGATQWAAGGLAVTNAVQAQIGPVVASDDSHGLLVAWVDSRNASSGQDIYLQHMSGSGTRLFAADQPVCTAASTQTNMVLCADAAGGAYLAWEDFRAVPTAIYAAHVGPGGTNTWTTDGLAVTSAALTSNRLPLGIVLDGFGGCVIGYSDFRTGLLDLYAQRLNPAGAPQWTTDGVALETHYTQPSFPFFCGDGRGGIITAYTSFRTSNAEDIYASRADRYGFVGLTEPLITSASDVKNDQGGKLKVSFNASYLEFDGFSIVSSYDIFRSVPAALAARMQRAGSRLTRDGAQVAADPAHTLLVAPANAQDYAFEFVANVTALDLPSYSYLVPTLGDSLGGSNPPTIVLVQARGSANRYWTSQPDSGYSVDNLAPLAPAPFTAQFAAGTARLHWNPNTEADLAGYRLYRGTSPDFQPSPANLLSAQADTGFVDGAGQIDTYKLTAVDVHGNESKVVTVTPTGVLAVGDSPLALAFAAPRPNPAVAGTTLRFVLPSAGVARLAIYDAAGREVRVLAAGEQSVGEHHIAWDLRGTGGDPAPAGLYFARLEAAGQTFVRRLAITR